jgi:LacI family transcriptional regulator
MQMGQGLLPSRRRIAVVMGTDMSCFRDVIRGINAFAGERRDWHLDLVSPIDDILGFLKHTKPDGLLLGPVSTAEEVDNSRSLVSCCVGLCARHSKGVEDSGWAEVESDDRAVGTLAAEHFVGKGYQHFAFVGTPAVWSQMRWEGFAQTVRESTGAGVSRIEYATGPSTIGRGWARPHYDSEDVLGWLSSLPKPLALLTCNDLRGRELCEVCLDAGIRVPEDVAILGVDNDDLECDLSHPPLSSVHIPWRQVGHRAATLLDDMLDGRVVTAKPYLLSPLGIVERQSTDTLAISDPELSMAIRYIRDNAHLPIGVDDVLQVVPTARRSLEKRFRAILGRSPLDEIRHVRVERAKRLLTGSDLSMSSIAEVCGFATAAWFTRTFHDLTGEAPTQYRQSRRAQ